MFALIAALTQAGGIIIDKITLTRRQVELKVFIPIVFLFLFLLSAILLPFLGHVSADFFKLNTLILFVLMIITAIIWNVFYYRGAQAEKVHEFEMIVIFQPLVTIILASFFLRSEQNWPIVVVSIIASLALILSKIGKEHFKITPSSAGLILAVVLMSIELIIIDVLLKVISPVAIYCVRTGILAIFFWLYYKPHVERVADHNVQLILFSSIFGVIQMVAKFYGFQTMGVVLTSLILILAPILTYTLSTFFLHEKLHWKQTVSFVIILICVIFATTFGR